MGIGTTNDDPISIRRCRSIILIIIIITAINDMICIFANSTLNNLPKDYWPASMFSYRLPFDERQQRYHYELHYSEMSLPLLELCLLLLRVPK